MRRRSRALILALVVLTPGAMVSCGDDATGPSTPKVRSIDVYPNPAHVRVDEDLVMVMTMSADSGADQTVVWESADPRRVVVSETGILTGVSVGPAVVTATSVANPGVTAVVTVDVAPAYTGVHRITASPQAVTLIPGQTQGVAATVDADSRVSRDVTYESDKSSVATVSAEGLITAVAIGSARIIARSAIDTSVSASVAVTVRAPNAANISIQAITTGGTGNPVNLQSVVGQVDVIVNVEPGEGTLTRVDLVVGNNGRDTVVASQSFSAAAANPADAVSPASGLGAIVLSFRSDAFNSVTGTTAFRNLPTTIKAVGVSVASTGTVLQSASGSVTAQLNNRDGFLVSVRGLSATGIASAVDANGRRWMQASRGIELRTIPVSYSGRPVGARTISFPGAAPAASITSLKLGEAVDTLMLPPAYVTATTGDSYLNGDLPNIVAVDATGNSLNLVTPLPGGAGAGIINAQAAYTGTARLEGMRIDNAPPPAAALVLSSAQANANNWVNGTYQFASGLTGLVGDPGVGLLGTSVAPTVASAAVTFHVIGGLLTDTVEVTLGSQLPPSNTNATYTLIARYADRLGNTRILPLSPAAGHPGTKFGVDVQPPVVRYSSGSIPGETLVSAGADSIYASATGVSGPRAFAVDAIDDRSGLADNRVGVTVVRFSQPNPVGSFTGTTTCVIGNGAACTPVFLPYESVLADQFRQQTTVLDAGSGVEGYYTYTATVQDQAGNVSAPITRRALIDAGTGPSAAVMTGLGISGVLVGGQPAAFLALAVDNVEIARGGLLIEYPNLPGASQMLAYSTPISGGTVIGTPFDAVLTSPIAGTHAAFTAPIFIRGLEVVSATDAPQAYPLATAKPISANAWVRDFVASSIPSTLAANSPISAALVQSPGPTPGFIGGIGTANELQQWKRQAGAGTLRFEAVGPSGQTLSPFARVILLRLEPTGLTVNANAWRVLGEVLTPVGIDNGLKRIWTYDFSSQSPGSYVAIGVSAAGDAIATQLVIL